MTHLADLTSQVVLRLREHFQIEGEPPPPCPASLVGWLRLNIAINTLRAALPPAGDFTSRDWQEITQHEVVERLRTITGDLSRQFATWNLKGRPGGIAAIPPIPQQAFISLCWATERLRAMEKTAPAPAAPVKPRGRPKGTTRDWKALVEQFEREQFESRITAAEFCRREGLTESTFSGHRKGYRSVNSENSPG